MKIDRNAVFGALALLAACVHEFAWQLVPDHMMGDFRAVTQSPLIIFILLGWAVASRNRFVAAVAMAIGIMSLSTAMCSLAWLIHPFETLPGEDQCSGQVGFPLLFVSVLGACVALTQWRPPNGR